MKDPGDAGWHIDGSYDVDGKWWVNMHSRRRGLLALFLFTDVGDADAPTEILVGSHLDVPRVLAPFGARGVFCGDVAGDLPGSTFKRSRARATGRAGDVYVCHPFLIHRATWPHLGSGPRVVAQPEIAHHEPFALRLTAPTCARSSGRSSAASGSCAHRSAGGTVVLHQAICEQQDRRPTPGSTGPADAGRSA